MATAKTGYIDNQWQGEIDYEVVRAAGSDTCSINFTFYISRYNSATINTATYQMQLYEMAGTSSTLKKNVSAQLDKAGWTSANQRRQIGSSYSETVTLTRKKQSIDFYALFERGSSDWVRVDFDVDIPKKVAQVKVNVNGTWKTGEVYVKANNVWWPADEVSVNVNGTWKPTYVQS